MVFSFVDVFTDDRYRATDGLRKGSGLEWLQETDVTENVKAAIVNRLRPDSFLRNRLKRQRGGMLGLQRVIEPLLLVNYGADFVGLKFTLMQRIFRSIATRLLLRSVSVPEIRMTRYIHFLAVKK